MSISRANSTENRALPQPPKDNTVKLANLWERMAGQEANHTAKQNTFESNKRNVSVSNQTSSPNSITLLSSVNNPAVERTPSLGASGRIPPRPTRSGTRELINELEGRCSQDVPDDNNSTKENPGSDGTYSRMASDGNSSGQLVRKLSSAEVDARAERAVDSAAVADMTELKQVVERMTRRVTDLEEKIQIMQQAMPSTPALDVGDSDTEEDTIVGNKSEADNDMGLGGEDSE